MTLKENEAQVMEWIFKSEGGFLESHSEPGGASNMGVSMATLTDWRALKRQPKPSILDLKALPKEEALEIYRFQYLRPIHFNELPTGVDYCMIDAAVQHGCSGSIRMLQKALGFRDPEKTGEKTHIITGDFDLITLWAVKNRKPDVLVKELMAVREDRHETILENKEKKMAGFKSQWSPIWKRRRNRVLERALGMLGVKENG